MTRTRTMQAFRAGVRANRPKRKRYNPPPAIDNRELWRRTKPCNGCIMVCDDLRACAVYEEWLTREPRP